MLSLVGRRMTVRVCGNVAPWEENRQAAAGGHDQCSRQDPSHKPSLPLQIEYVTSETLLMESAGMNPASA